MLRVNRKEKTLTIFLKKKDVSWLKLGVRGIAFGKVIGEAKEQHNVLVR